MSKIDWKTIKVEDLKNSDYLIKAFCRYLKKECEYSNEAAKFTADIIENPYGKFADVNKTYELDIEIDGVVYEAYFCTAEDSSPKLFEFYMLVDKNSVSEKLDDKEWRQSDDREWFAYYLAKKKYIVCWK